jgi:hypothetical protein
MGGLVAVDVDGVWWWLFLFLFSFFLLARRVVLV